MPQAFDAPLGPRAVFSLAAPFIKSCPDGSNLKVEAFPKLAMEQSADSQALAVGTSFKVKAEGGSGATNCAFTSGGVFPGGTAFSNFTEADGCQVPQGVAGITYVTLTNSAPLSGALSDDIIVAGPMAVAIS